MVIFNRMCERCYRIVGDNEQLFAIKLLDDNNKEKVFIGHKECLEEIVSIMYQLYGQKENGENGNK